MSCYRHQGQWFSFFSWSLGVQKPSYRDVRRYEKHCRPAKTFSVAVPNPKEELNQSSEVPGNAMDSVTNSFAHIYASELYDARVSLSVQFEGTRKVER
jgi:hypothetical protein